MVGFVITSTEEEIAISVYIVASGSIESPEMLAEYLGKAVATIPAEARVLAVDETADVIEGDLHPPRVVLIEFPTRESFPSELVGRRKSVGHHWRGC